MKILLDTCHSNKKWVKFLILTTDLNFCRAGQKTRSLKLKLKLQQQKSCQTFVILHYSVRTLRVSHFTVFERNYPQSIELQIRVFGSKYSWKGQCKGFTSVIFFQSSETRNVHIWRMVYMIILKSNVMQII